MIDLSSIPLVMAARGSYGGTRRAEEIRYLIYHYTGNDGDTDANNANYFKNNVVEASAHYFVDDDSVTQSVPDLTIAYAVGGDKWADCGKTGGGSMYGIIKNRNSISIEMCDTRRDGTIMATEATLARAIELGRALMAKYSIPIERVYRHFDVTGKHCPAYFMDAGQWAEFKSRLEGPDVTEERVKELIDAAVKAARPAVYTSVEECPEWARPTVQAAVDKGVLKGDQAGRLHLTDDNLVNLQMLANLGLLKGGDTQ